MARAVFLSTREALGESEEEDDAECGGDSTPRWAIEIGVVTTAFFVHVSPHWRRSFDYERTSSGVHRLRVRALATPAVLDAWLRLLRPEVCHHRDGGGRVDVVAACARLRLPLLVGWAAWREFVVLDAPLAGPMIQRVAECHMHPVVTDCGHALVVPYVATEYMRDLARCVSGRDIDLVVPPMDAEDRYRFHGGGGVEAAASRVLLTAWSGASKGERDLMLRLQRRLGSECDVVPNADLEFRDRRARYAACRVLVLMDSDDARPWPREVLEALVNGVPVVTSGAGGGAATRLVGDAGLYVPNVASSDLAVLEEVWLHTIRRVQTDDRLYAALSETARRRGAEWCDHAARRRFAEALHRAVALGERRRHVVVVDFGAASRPHRLLVAALASLIEGLGVRVSWTTPRSPVPDDVTHAVLFGVDPRRWETLRETACELDRAGVRHCVGAPECERLAVRDAAAWRRLVPGGVLCWRGGEEQALRCRGVRTVCAAPVFAPAPAPEPETRLRGTRFLCLAGALHNDIVEAYRAARPRAAMTMTVLAISGWIGPAPIAMDGPVIHGLELVRLHDDAQLDSLLKDHDWFIDDHAVGSTLVRTRMRRSITFDTDPMEIGCTLRVASTTGPRPDFLMPTSRFHVDALADAMVIASTRASPPALAAEAAQAEGSLDSTLRFLALSRSSNASGTSDATSASGPTYSTS